MRHIYSIYRPIGILVYRAVGKTRIGGTAVTEVAAPPKRLCVRGDALAAALRERGVTDGEPEQGLVLDLHDADPQSWQQLEALLVDAYALSKRAFDRPKPIAPEPAFFCI